MRTLTLPQVSQRVCTLMRPDRNVCFIVGNGIAMECGGLSSNKIKDWLLDKPNFKELAYEWINRDATETLKTGVRGGKNNIFHGFSLEELCFVLAKVIPGGMEEVLRLLKEALEKFGPSTPGLSHELISHFVGHGLVQFIIDFNFDDLLTRALREELGEKTLHIYNGETDFSKLDRKLSEESTELPVVLKPHGSISSPKSIRISMESVEEYSSLTFRVLSKIFEKSHTIIIAGYSGRDPDFKNFLQRLTKGRPDFFQNKPVVWVNIEDASKSQEDDTFSYFGPKMTSGATSDLNVINQEAGKFFESLATACSRAYGIPGIARHQIRSHLIPKVDVDHQIKAMLFLEILIFGAKARGYFELDGFYRCNKLVAYLKYAEERRNAHGENVSDLFRQMQKIGIILPAPGFPSGSFTCEPQELGGQALEFFRSWMKGTGNSKYLNDLFEKLANEPDIDICPGGDPTMVFRYRNPVPIKDMYEFKEKTREILTNSNEEIFIVSERGEWLIRSEWGKYFKKRRVKVLLVGSPGPGPGRGTQHPYFHSRAQKTLKTLKRRYEVLHANDSRIETHITMNDSGQALVFRRFNRAPITSPYFISNPDGYEEVKNEFKKNWDNVSIPS